VSYRYRQGVAILDPLSSGRGRLTAAGQRAAKASSKSACSIRNVAVSTAPRPAAGKLLTHATLPPKRSQREETPMRRRELLKAGLGLAAALAASRIGGAAAANTLVVAPTGDLVVLDPVVTFNR
jgi:hypothetical protein